MSIETAPVAVAAESSMFAALASILTDAALVTDDLDALVAADNDTTADDGARHFVRRVVEWLAQQSAQHDFQVWSPNFDARH